MRFRRDKSFQPRRPSPASPHVQLAHQFTPKIQATIESYRSAHGPVIAVISILPGNQYELGYKTQANLEAEAAGSPGLMPEVAREAAEALRDRDPGERAIVVVYDSPGLADRRSTTLELDLKTGQILGYAVPGAPA